MADIKVILDKKYDIHWKCIIEEELDKAFGALGFCRDITGVETDGSITIGYRQFAVAHEVKE